MICNIMSMKCIATEFDMFMKYLLKNRLSNVKMKLNTEIVTSFHISLPI